MTESHAMSERVALRRNRWAFVALAYATALAAASLMPAGGTSAAVAEDVTVAPSIQNFLHLPAYAILAALLLTATDRTWRLCLRGTLAVVAISMVYGGILEGLQAVIGQGRTGDWSDAWRNAVGSMAGLLVWRSAGALRHGGTQPSAEFPSQLPLVSTDAETTSC